MGPDHFKIINQQIIEQAGNQILPFPFRVTLEGESCDTTWAVLNRNRFDPIKLEYIRPYGILVNTIKDIYDTNYITPRWLKIALNPDFNDTIRKSVPAQHMHLVASGFSHIEASEMHRFVEVEIEDRPYLGTLSTHYGRSIEAILKRTNTPEVIGIASAAYALSAVQAIILARKASIINGQNLHVLHGDPNPGNVLLMVRRTGVAVINYDMTNKIIYQRKANDNAISEMWYKYTKGAREKGLSLPTNIDTLLAMADEFRDIMSQQNTIDLAYNGLIGNY
ncbi:hypothetical protein H3C67_04740 [Candidatus Dojkabacteria bacterium]|uniref:Protein kinase domain-containing protein n=2 Tax=Candidatus Dojkabacteria TaxID=74243 RepID=A0A952DUR6_9BACT|nr:hypothetical protein [Candidatus Dojkabacteria bacterium]